jgi:anti-anti-sigma regulatory factor
MSQHTLRISIQQTADNTEIVLEGRIAGPWAAELTRTWSELAPTVQREKLSIDLRNTTYADASGIEALREIYSQTAARFVTSTPLTQYLADEITAHALPTDTD